MSARHRSPIFASAVESYHSARAEFGILMEAAYAQAEEDCRGALINARGRRAGVDAFSLFMGAWSRAKAYASPELIEWWATHPRITWTEFERQYTEREIAA